MEYYIHQISISIVPNRQRFIRVCFKRFVIDAPLMYSTITLYFIHMPPSTNINMLVLPYHGRISINDDTVFYII